VHAQLGRRIKGIAETTRADVSKTIADGLTNGQSLDEIASSVRTLIGGDSYKNRSQVIALSESAHAYNVSSIASYKESGVIDSAELADNPDHDTDPWPPTDTTCADRDQLVVSLDDAQGYIDSMHPRCIMAVIPVLATPLGEG
jgi:SPP1 gp7 family putative phage head morphogenesis protein